MTIILFFGIIFCILLLNRNKYVLQFVIIACAIFFSLRSDTVPDTKPYQEWFYNPPFGTSIEIGYCYLCEFFRYLGFSFREFLFVIALLELEIWYLCTRKLFPKFNYSLLLALCLCYYGIYFWGCVLRASIAISMGYIGITILLKSNQSLLMRLVLYSLLIYLASLIHISALIYLICPFLLFNYSPKVLGIIFIATVFIGVYINYLNLTQYFTGIIEKIDDATRLQNYITREKFGGYSFFWITALIISSLSIYNYQSLTKGDDCEIRGFFIKLYLIGTWVLSLTLKIPAGSRLGMMFTFFEFIVVYILIKHLLHSKSIQIIVSIGFIMLKFSYFLHQFPLFLGY